jgi:hypothetical protein
MSNHLDICQSIGDKRISFPTKKFFEWNNMNFLENTNFQAYYDFICESKINSDEKTMVGYVVLLVDPFGKVSKMIEYTGDYAMKHFLNTVKKTTAEIVELVSKTNLPISMTDEEIDLHRATSHCLYCKKPFSPPKSKNQRIIHHHHYLPAKIRGYQSICQACNFKIRAQAICWLAHGASTFHHRLIINELTSDSRSFKIVGGCGTEIPGILYCGKTMFIDVKKFITGSTQEIFNQHLGNDCFDTTEKFPILDQMFSGNKAKMCLTAQQFEKYTKLVTSTNSDDNTYSVFAESPKMTDYELFDMWCNVFDNGYRDEFLKQFPEGAFGNEAKCIYLYTRVSILADATKRFVDYCMTNFGLTPLQFFGTGSFSFCAAFSNVPERFEYIRNIKMIKMFNAAGSMRGRFKLLDCFI